MAGARLSNAELAELYRAYYPRVYNHVYYQLLHREQAEDVVGDVFVKVVRNLDRFDSTKASFSTWLFHITHNTLVDFYRRNKTTVSLDEVDTLEPAAEDEYPGLDDHAAEVRRMLTLIDDADRELIFLKFYREMKNADIAQLLDMNVSTVSTNLSRALRRIRDEWSDLLDA